MKRRILAIVFAVIMITALVGCGSSRRDIVQLTLSSEDSTAILAAGITLPDAEETAAAGTTIEWFCWYDPFHNYSEDEIINTGYYTFTEKYGCEIEWVETTYSSRNDDLANLILSSQSPDFTRCGTSNTPLHSRITA
ncbi:MAG: hypothetical protein LIO49_09380 [Ruminococcus sp.]|nr:hypothetical protein [Ruminococcus sp.]